MKNLLTVTAAIEAGAGAVLLMAPSMITRLLLDTSLDLPGGLAVTRVVGAVLLVLGIACWYAGRDERSRAAIGVVAAMLACHFITVVVIAVAGLAYNLSGAGLTPVSVLHAALAGWCIACLRPMNPSSTPRSASPPCSIGQLRARSRHMGEMNFNRHQE